MSEAPQVREPDDRRIFLTAGVADFTLHMFLGAVSYRARDLGATPWEIGLVGASGDVAYTVCCLVIGSVSERTGRRAAVAGAAAVFAASGFLAWSAVSMPVFVAALVAQRVASAVFWPTVQGRLADQSSNLGRDAGLFNLSWSAGKTVGYFGNFLMFSFLGLPTGAAFVVSGVASAMIAFAMPPDRKRKATLDAGPRVDPAEAEFARKRVGVALIGNFAGVAAFTVVMNQAAPLMAARGLDKGVGSFVTACFVLSQMGVFWFVSKRHDVAGRSAAMLGATLMILLGLGSFFASRSPVALCVSTLLLGAGAGLAYAQAMLLSLRLPSAATKGAGRHEAVVGAASATTAPLAGLVATASGRPDAAIGTAAAIVGLLGFAQWFKLRSRGGDDAAKLAPR